MNETGTQNKRDVETGTQLVGTETGTQLDGGNGDVDGNGDAASFLGRKRGREGRRKRGRS